MGRHANGEGTIYRRKDGRYEAALYVRTTSGDRKRVRKIGKTRQEAYNKLAEVKTLAQQGIPVPDKTWKLGDYLDYWLENVVRATRRATTYERHEGIVRLYLKPGLGTYPLTYLTVPVVQNFLNQQLADGQSVSTIQTIRKVLSAALTRAQREELLSRNVARLVELPVCEQADRAPWTAEEAKAFLDAAQGDSLCTAFVLLMLYGMRRGEVLGLRWADIDVGQRVLHVRQQLQRYHGALHQGPLKTKAGRRDLPLLDFTLQALERQREAQLAARARAGAAWKGGSAVEELVFTTASGLPIEPRNFVRSFKRICTQNDIRIVRIHDIRHAVATLLKDAGVPARDTQLILGHANISTTQQIYQHDTIDSRRGALGNVERLFWRGADSARCRQNCHFQPSNQQIVDQITSFISGAEGETRTRDPRLTITVDASIYDRATEVNRLVDVRRKTWLLGLVAVSVAVKFDE